MGKAIPRRALARRRAPAQSRRKASISAGLRATNSMPGNLYQNWIRSRTAWLARWLASPLCSRGM